MHYLRNLSGITLFVILAMLSACGGGGGSDDGDSSVSGANPCGTVVDIGPECKADERAIDAWWDSLEDLITTSPDNTAIANWVNSHIGDDYLSNGQDKAGLLNDWLLGDGPAVGQTFSAVITGVLDVTGTTYIRGYSLRVTEDRPGRGIDHFTFLIVFNGTGWYGLGNGQWVETDVGAWATMVKAAFGTTFSTGIKFQIDDELDYAYEHGTRSAIVSGPGLATGGMIFEHQFPGTSFVIYQTGENGLTISDDALISSISDNAEYTYVLCSETAATLDVNGVGFCTKLQTYTVTLIKPPVLNADLNASLFATLTEPSTHYISDLNFGGVVSISWNTPADTPAGYVEFGWSSDGVQYRLDVSDEEGDDLLDNNVLLDTTGLPVPDNNFAGVLIEVGDDFEREFNTSWQFSE